MSLLRKIVILLLLVASTEANAQLLREVHSKGHVYMIEDEIKSVNENVTYRFFFNETGKQVMYSKNRGELVRFDLLQIVDGMWRCEDEQGIIVFNVTDLVLEMFWEEDEELHQWKYSKKCVIKIPQ